MRRKTREQADSAFVDFMVAAQPSLLRLAYFLTGSQDQARELTQEALVRAYVKWPQIRADGALAYTRRILANARIDRGRSAAREVASPNPHDTPHLDGANVEDHDELVALLRTLPEGQRKVVVLRYCYDLSDVKLPTHLISRSAL